MNSKVTEVKVCIEYNQLKWSADFSNEVVHKPMKKWFNDNTEKDLAVCFVQNFSTVQLASYIYVYVCMQCWVARLYVTCIFI